MTKQRFIELIAQEGLTDAGSVEELWSSRPPEVDQMSEEEVIRALRFAVLIFSLQKSAKAGLN